MTGSEQVSASQPSVELVHADEIGMGRLQRRPIIDRIDERQLALIKKTLAVGESPEYPITDAEIGHFLELSALYGLDPFAREIWIAKSKRGKLLIMVGRDGLRKVAHRNALRVEGDVICEKDTFSAEFVDDDTERMARFGGRPFHAVTHVKSGIGVEQRGPVVGAWCRVTTKAGVESGYFDAPISEYKPANVDYSPWGKQVSAMMLGAVERQAIRQATPLGGVMAEGEDHFVDSTAVDIGAGEGDGSPPPWEGVSDEHVAQIEALMARAEAAGFPALADVGTVRLRLNMQPAAAVEEWIAAGEAQVQAVEESRGQEGGETQ